MSTLSLLHGYDVYYITYIYILKFLYFRFCSVGWCSCFFSTFPVLEVYVSASTNVCSVHIYNIRVLVHVIQPNNVIRPAVDSEKKSNKEIIYDLDFNFQQNSLLDSSYDLRHNMTGLHYYLQCTMHINFPKLHQSRFLFQITTFFESMNTDKLPLLYIY